MLFEKAGKAAVVVVTDAQRSFAIAVLHVYATLDTSPQHIWKAIKTHEFKKLHERAIKVA